MTNEPAGETVTAMVQGVAMAGWRGGRVAVGDASDRVPVVLVHGFGMSGTYLMPTARLLARTRRVFVPDLPGHGRSGVPARALDVGALADALVAWLHEAGVHRAVLLGNSMGAQVVAEAARRRPGLGAALVLVGPTFDPALPAVPGLIGRVLADVPRERPSLVPIVARDYLRMGVRRLWREFVGMRAHDVAAALRAAGAPTLVVRGEHDPLASPAWCRTLAAVAGGEMRTVAGAGHAVNHGAPAALADLVERFADRVADGALARTNVAAGGAMYVERATR